MWDVMGTVREHSAMGYHCLKPITDLVVKGYDDHSCNSESTFVAKESKILKASQ